MIKANVNEWNVDVHIIGNLEQIAAEMSIMIKRVYDLIEAGGDKGNEAAEVFREHLVELISDDEIMHMKADKG